MMKIGVGKKRIYLTRFIAIALIAIQMTTTHSWAEESWLDTLLEVVGLLFLSIAALGRGWSSLFISGHKTHDLITTGPYSVVRNPLYVFSFIGAIGVGLCSENLVVLSSLILLFALYYPLVIKAEEVVLLSTHGTNFTDYMKKVPRFFPNLSLYVCTPTYEIDTTRVLRSLRDCLAFLCVYPAFEVIEHLRSAGHLPIITTIPSGITFSLKSIFGHFF